MNLLLLGHGKTGSIVAEIARHHGHTLDILDEPDNTNAAGLTADRLRAVDVVIDFTTPHAVLPNIHACIRERKNMVVGTTGGYQHMPEIKKLGDRAAHNRRYWATKQDIANVLSGLRTAADDLLHLAGHK